MQKNNIIRGTLILTLAGIITRLIGFFYKIYLSNTLGAEKLGVYQLIFPIYGICFTLYAAGIQTSISQLIASEIGKRHTKECSQSQIYHNIKRILITGITCSLLIALILSVLVYHNAAYIAEKIVLEPACTGSFRVLAYIFPFCGITACINGYYYGLKKAAVPAATQLIEQIVRVISVYVIALYAGGGNMAVTCELAVLGVVIGEIASHLYNIISLFITKPSFADLFTRSNLSIMSNPRRKKNTTYLKKLSKLSIPLTANRLVISLLHSFEAILIPSMLRKSGLSNSEALSIYGILIGMSIPFIMFPSTITNSLSVLLLPTVSEAQAVKNQKKIQRTSENSIKYSLLIGLLSTGIFIIFGNNLGYIVFHNKEAGAFLVTLSWLCPFMYLSTTLGSIINGLGKTHLTFINTVTSLGIRILFTIYLVPARGIYGYLIGLLVSQLAVALLDYLALKGSVEIHFNAIQWLLKPSIILVTLGFITKKSYLFFIGESPLDPLLLLFLSCLFLTITFLASLICSKIISLKELR